VTHRFARLAEHFRLASSPSRPFSSAKAAARGARQLRDPASSRCSALEGVEPGEVLPDPSREPWTEAVPQLDESGEGDLVARVVDEAQVGEHVLDVPVLEEAQPRADPERDVPLRVSSTCRSREWAWLRYSTAMSSRSKPSSRSSRRRSAAWEACASGVGTAISRGRSPPLRSGLS
jgi:hypothetical protein